jgi:hypothetical protein
MKREIINTVATCLDDIDMAGFVDKPLQWLSQQMYAHGLKYLLAHADDGVIWGRLDDEELITSHDVAPEYSPPLRAATLQTVRLFARAGELFVWRDEAGVWTGRLIAETTLLSGMTARRGFFTSSHSTFLGGLTRKFVLCDS